MNFVGVIPARGGSKGIKMKNLISFNGKPLIYWTIRHAKTSKLLDDFFVSSDNEEILNYAISQGVKVHYRNSKLSSDDSTTLDLLMSLNEEKIFFRKLCDLATYFSSKKKNIIDECISIFIIIIMIVWQLEKCAKVMNGVKLIMRVDKNLKDGFMMMETCIFYQEILFKKGNGLELAKKK